MLHGLRLKQTHQPNTIANEGGLRGERPAVPGPEHPRLPHAAALQQAHQARPGLQLRESCFLVYVFGVDLKKIRVYIKKYLDASKITMTLQDRTVDALASFITRKLNVEEKRKNWPERDKEYIEYPGCMVRP